MDAIKYYQTKQWDKLRDYCLQDVAVTRDIYDFGLRKGHVKFRNKWNRLIEAGVDFKFIPEFVDRKIYDAIVTKAEQTLSEALANKDHEFRQRLLESLFACIVRLETSEELQATVQQAKNALLNSDIFREYVGSLRDAMLKTLEEDVTNSDSVIILAVQRVLEDLMKTLVDSPQFQRKCNRIVRNVLSALVGNDSRVVADLISRTVDSWDVKTLSEKLEEQVGADLQFIRINGTLVGGVAGVALYAASRYLE